MFDHHASAHSARRSRTLRTLTGWLAVAALVMIVHGALLWVHRTPQAKRPLGDELTYLEAAHQIAQGQPSAQPLLWPPLYAHVLAWTMPDGPDASRVPAQLLQVVLLLIAAALMRDITRRALTPSDAGTTADADATGPRWAPTIAAALTLSYPPLAAFAYDLWPEVLHLTLMLGALWILMARRTRLAWMPILGGLLGLALLTKSLLGPFLPALLLPLALDGRRRLLRALVVAAALAAVVLPTVVHNGSTRDAWTIANSGYFNLWVGINDTERASFARPMVVVREYSRYLAAADDHTGRTAAVRRWLDAAWHEPGPLVIVAGRLRVQYFRLFDRESYLTAQLPGGTLAGYGAGFPDAPALPTAVLRALSAAMYPALLLLALLGIALHDPRRHPWLGLLLAFLAYNLLLFLVLHVKSRYRVQLLPVVFVFAAAALDQLRVRGLRLPLSRTGWIALAAAAAVALLLVYGGPLLPR
ncbi:MAG: hypothetical protein AAF772_04845 [Acidobacteriota bacterium]